MKINNEEGSFWHGSLCSFTFSALLLRPETRLGRLLWSELDFSFFLLGLVSHTQGLSSQFSYGSEKLGTCPFLHVFSHILPTLTLQLKIPFSAQQ